MKSYGDILSKSTENPVGYGIENLQNNQREDDDLFTPEDISNLMDTNGFLNDLQNIDIDDGKDKRTFEILRKRVEVSDQMLIEADVRNNFVFVNDYIHVDENNDDSSDSGVEVQFQLSDIPSLIEVISGTLLRCTDEYEALTNIENLNSFK